MKNITDEKLKELYIDFIFNFVLVSDFADHYNMQYVEAYTVIDQGRTLVSNDNLELLKGVF
jgi:hypothetical protein